MTSKHETLRNWINPRYLENVNAYSDDALIKGVVLDDFFLSDRLAQVEEFMQNEAEYAELYRVLDESEAPIVNREEWLKYPEERRFCFRNLVSGAKAEFQDSRNFRAFQELWSLLESTSFSALMSRLIGELCYTAMWAAIRHKQQHFLIAHDDVISGRMLNATFYLSSGWQQDFGGELTLFEKKIESKRIAPLFNRMVLMKPSKENEHQVELLNSGAGEWQRLCFVFRCKDIRMRINKLSID